MATKDKSKIPLTIFETTTFEISVLQDFVEWIDVPRKKDKMENELKNSLNLNQLDFKFQSFAGHR